MLKFNKKRVNFKIMLHKFNRKVKSLRCLLICLLIFSISSPVVMSGVVLCVGADGHVAIERVVTKCCVSLNTTLRQNFHNSSLSDALSNKEHCPPCKDIPIVVSNSNQNIISGRTTTSQIKTTPCSFFSLSLPVPAKNSTENYSYYSPPRVNLSLASLNTVILLI